MDIEAGLASGAGQATDFIGFEGYLGSAWADIFMGSDGADFIIGEGGDDVVTGGGGDDEIRGGAGDDSAVFSGARSAYTVVVGSYLVTVSGPDGIDVLSGVEWLQFADMRIAAAKPLRLSGTAGDDTLNGSPVDDVLAGGAGNDTMLGGFGNDLIDGGADFDTLIVSGNRSDYRLLMTADDAFILKGTDGGDRLIGVEVIRFEDGSTVDLLRQDGSDGWGSLADGLEDFGAPHVLPGSGRDAGGEGPGPLVQPRSRDEALKVKNTFDVPRILPGAEEETLWSKDHDQPLVLPGVDDGAGWNIKDFGEPLVLPGADDAAPLFSNLEARLALTGGWMLTLDEQGRLDGEPAHRHDDWM